MYGRIQAKVIELKTAPEVQQRSPYAYTVFGSILKGRFLAYDCKSPEDFEVLLTKQVQGV